MTRILVLDGHPAPASLCRSLAQRYADAAREAGHELRVVHLHDLDFDADFGLAGYGTTKPLEPSLQKFLDDLAWCGHFVLFTPMWWGGLPALTKGFIDRLFDLVSRYFAADYRLEIGQIAVTRLQSPA